MMPHDVDGQTRTEVSPGSFRGRPQEWARHWTLALDWTHRLFAEPSLRARFSPYLACMGVDSARGERACRKAAAVLLGEDAQKAVLSADEAPVAAGCAVWLSALEPRRRWRPIPGRVKAGLRLAAYWVYLVIETLRRSAEPRPAAPAAILFDQYYDHLDDQEFLAFYRYFKTRGDIVYNCPDRRCEKYRFLERAGRRPLAHRWSVPWQRKPAELRRLARLGVLFLLDRATPLAFKLATARLFRDRLRYQSLLDAVPCQRFLRVRFDMEASHPLVTALCEERRSRHVGYSCGSYPDATPFYAMIDFHEYGLLGRGFKEETFRGLWPDATRYEVLGPFTYELDPGTSTSRLKGSVIGVFPTSYLDEFYMQRPFFEQLIEASIGAAKTTGAALFFKVKDRSDAHAARIEAACRGRVAFDLAYNDACEGRPPRRAPDALRACDLAVVMGPSTVAWEALGSGRKVLVFEQAWRTHPFESVEPRLVVKSPEALACATAWLLALPQADYDRLAAPVIERWAKRCDGRLVQDFIGSLEHDH